MDTVAHFHSCDYVGGLVAERRFSSQSAGTENMAPSTIEQVDRLFEKWEKPNTPGAVLAILKDGKIIYSRGYGMAKLEESIPPVCYRFPSWLCDQAIHRVRHSPLGERRQVVSRRRCSKISSGSSSTGKPITIRQLLHHTGTLRDQSESSGFGRLALVRCNRRRRCSPPSYAIKGTECSPGEEMLYSNSGYSVLAEMVATRLWHAAEAVREREYGPLEMNDTKYQANCTWLNRHL